MKATERCGLAIDRALVGEQLAGLAPVDHVGGPSARGQPAQHPGRRQRDRRHLPRERLGRRREADVDDALAAHPAADQLADHEPLAGAKLELPQVDRAATQANAVVGDLAGPPRADEHAAASDRHDEAVDTRRTSTQVEDDIDHAADVGAVGSHQREPREASDINDPIRHTQRVDSAAPTCDNRK